MARARARVGARVGGRVGVRVRVTPERGAAAARQLEPLLDERGQLARGQLDGAAGRAAR